jgi:hypothetical protein
MLIILSVIFVIASKANPIFIKQKIPAIPNIAPNNISIIIYLYKKTYIKHWPQLTPATGAYQLSWQIARQSFK